MFINIVLERINDAIACVTQVNRDKFVSVSETDLGLLQHPDGALYDNSWDLLCQYSGQLVFRFRKLLSHYENLYTDLLPH